MRCIHLKFISITEKCKSFWYIQALLKLQFSSLFKKVQAMPLSNAIWIKKQLQVPSLVLFKPHEIYAKRYTYYNFIHVLKNVMYILYKEYILCAFCLLLYDNMYYLAPLKRIDVNLATSIFLSCQTLNWTWKSKPSARARVMTAN